MSHPSTTFSRAAKSSTPDQPPGWAPAALTTLLLTALGVLMVGQMYAVLALLNPMATALGTTPGQATWTATAFGFAYAAGFLLAGPLSDRHGPHRDHRRTRGRRGIGSRDRRGMRDPAPVVGDGAMGLWKAPTSSRWSAPGPLRTRSARRTPQKTSQHERARLTH
ncbi:MFS transporter [Kitasatospora sp. NPDC051914]|uniref:MFS transporter n=1 Tax=Kitasatospora sp. NPDC051914 TaxID=3154945 RepID=UPI00342DCD1B